MESFDLHLYYMTDADADRIIAHIEAQESALDATQKTLQDRLDRLVAQGISDIFQHLTYQDQQG